MNLMKKSLCGIITALSLCNISSTKAFDQLHFCRLNMLQREIMPPLENRIVFEKLPYAYKYLQELFFLSIIDKQEKGNIRSLIALQSFIEIICIQMKGIMRLNADFNSNVFIELICLIYEAAKVELCDSGCGGNMYAYLEKVLRIYRQIDSNPCNMKELLVKKSYKHYSDIKTYMCLKYMNYSAKHPVVVSVINNYVSEKFSADQIINYRLHLAKGIVAGYANSGSTTVPPTVETSSTSRVNKRRRGSIEPKEKQEIHENLGQQTSKRARRK